MGRALRKRAHLWDSNDEIWMWCLFVLNLSNALDPEQQMRSGNLFQVLNEDSIERSASINTSLPMTQIGMATLEDTLKP